jgi:cell wall-associated NlpC family hydrolase
MIGASAVALAGCATTNAVPRPFPSPDWDRVATKTDVPAAPPASAVDGVAASDPSTAIPADGFPPPLAPGSLTSRRYDGRAVAEFALGFRGVPYRLGGADPAGFDCSGLVHYVFAQYGVLVPRVVEEQYQAGEKVKAKDIKPGDLLFFATKGPGATHVAIAVGEDRFVHAPNSTGVVRVETLMSTYWGSRYIGARRITGPTTTD